MDTQEILRLLNEAIRTATPLALGAYCGIMCERAGVINIGIEGMMLISALTGQLAAQFIGSAWVGTPLEPYGLPLGLLVGLTTGLLLGLLHGWLSIRFKINQIVSGVVLNLAALGITGVLYQFFLAGGQAAGVPASIGTFPIISIPILKDIPVLGVIFFQHKPIVYMMLIATVAIHYVLYYTPWGLRTRAVGEHPRAADTLGINVQKIRYANVMIGGMLAGLAGAWLTLETNGNFDLEMTSGRGFIALAAMIFGKWTPLGSFGAALVFSIGQVLQISFQTRNLVIPMIGGGEIPIPYQFMQMAPYLLTMVALAGLVGRAIPPAADGVPYEK